MMDTGLTMRTDYCCYNKFLSRRRALLAARSLANYTRKTFTFIAHEGVRCCKKISLVERVHALIIVGTTSKKKCNWVFLLFFVHHKKLLKIIMHIFRDNLANLRTVCVLVVKPKKPHIDENPMYTHHTKSFSRQSTRKTKKK